MRGQPAEREIILIQKYRRIHATINLFIIFWLILVISMPTSIAEESENTKESGKLQYVVFPLIFSSPETGLGGGVTTVITMRENRKSKPGSLSAVAFYTQQNQYMFAITPSFYTPSDKWKLSITALHNYFPSEFYGTGSHVSSIDNEEYTMRTSMLKPSALYKLRTSLRAGLFFEVKNSDTTQIMEDGLLDSGNYYGTGKRLLSGGGLVIEFDTRDNIFYPGHGALHNLSAGVYRDWLGSDYEYETYQLDLRKYTPVSDNTLVALQFHVNTVHGQIPFDEYATLKNMRGIERARYRDFNSFSFRAEYRFPISGRWIGAGFASTGDVLENAGEWRPVSQKTAGGVGIRYMLNKEEKINFRFDLGFSEDGGKVYFRLMEAF